MTVPETKKDKESTPIPVKPLTALQEDDEFEDFPSTFFNFILISLSF